MAERLDFHDLLHSAVTARAAVGGTLSVADEDGTIECAVGITSAISRIPVDGRTLFRLESLTKLITTTVILQLCDLGLVGLDDRVLDHLPSVRESGLGDATIRHLLSHQSGLPDLPDGAHASLDQSIGGVASSLAALPPLFEPGTNLSYSGSGFVVLGAVVERVTGLSWETAVREGVLVPLGLAQTCATPDEALAHRAALGHVLGDGRGTRVVTDPVPRGLSPAAGLFSSTTDLLRLASLYASRSVAPAGVPVISDRSAAEATRGERPLVSGFAPGLTQGLGWQVASWSGRRFLMHHSFGRGTSGHVCMEQESGRGFAILVNSDSGENACIDLSRTLLHELFGVTIPAFPEHGPSGERSPDAYAGTYVHDAEHRFFVEADGDGGLELRATDVYQMAGQDPLGAPIRQVDDERFAHGSGYVLFGDFDAGGVAHTLHVQNHLARRSEE